MSNKDNWDDSSDDEGDAPPDPLFKGDAPPDPLFKGGCGDHKADLLRFSLYPCKTDQECDEDEEYPEEYPEEGGTPPHPPEEETYEGGTPPEETYTGGVGGYPPDYESDEYDDYEDQMDKKLGRYVSYR